MSDVAGGTPLFLITNVGLAAASTASPGGPYIHIIQFEIGSAYGYTPQTTDTGLNGTILYTAAPTSWNNIGNDTINIICEIPPQAGPFDFGEVGIFCQDIDGNPFLFAKAVFDTPQTKFSSLGTNVVSSYTLNCLLKLQQSTAIFQIDTLNNPPSVVDIYQWSDVYPPGISANPDVPLYVVRELSIYGDSTLLQNTSDAEWTVGTTYTPYLVNGLLEVDFTVTNSTTSWVQVAASQCHANDLAAANRVLLLQTPDGFFRSVKSVTTSGSNYQFNLNVTNDGTYNNYPLPTAPGIGSSVRLYRSEGQIYYSQITGGPTIPLATVGTPGLAYGSSGTYMPTAGVIEAFGMLQAPSTNTGRVLTSADNLNSVAYGSGMYTANGASGFPANLPFSYACNVWIHNIGNGTSSANGSDVTQIVYPWNDGGGTNPSGIGGYPPYWRQGFDSGASWTDWMPLAVPGRSSLVAGSFLPNVQFAGYVITTTPHVQTLTGTAPANGAVFAFQVLNNSGANGTGSRISNEIQVVSPGGTSSNGDTLNMSAFNISVNAVQAGQSFTVTGTMTLISGAEIAISQQTGYLFIPSF